MLKIKQITSVRAKVNKGIQNQKRVLCMDKVVLRGSEEGIVWHCIAGLTSSPMIWTKGASAFPPTAL